MPLQPTELASQNTAQTRTALANLLGAFTGGDRERLAACYDDDVDWLFLAPASVFPFAGTRRGKAEVFRGFEVLFQSYRITEYYVEAMLVDGDWASTYSVGQMLQLATQRTIRIRTGNFYRFRDGKVAEYRGFTDSLDIVEQVLGRELDF
ncbi:MAG: nuclear transport factor 2 family protein [Proteobacteria bacterium]|nr:nuclear transport factor 2 family protein [Pseudomonadota bacterium]